MKSDVSGMLRCVDLIRTYVSEELSTTISRVTRMGEVGTRLTITSNPRTLRRKSMCRLLVTANVPYSPILVALLMEALRSSETSFLTKSTPRNILEDGILHSHRSENLKSYIECEFLC
jgi:hypothetical protein